MHDTLALLMSSTSNDFDMVIVMTSPSIEYIVIMPNGALSNI